MLAGAVAVAADILAGAGRAGRGFVAWGGWGVAHPASNRPRRGWFRLRNQRTGDGFSRAMTYLKRTALAAAALLPALAATPAHADEVFGGVYAHDVDWVTSSGIEDGVDVEIGWRGKKLEFLDAIGGPRPHVLLSVNSAGDTSFAAAGISWKIGRTLYLRPGVGVAVHTGPDHFDPTRRRIWLGSRVLFEPELGIGVRLNDRASVEASWVHLSHAQLLNKQNPGLDTVGVRFNYRFR
jgi:lipid A 3-O-deacylase